MKEGTLFTLLYVLQHQLAEPSRKFKSYQSAPHNYVIDYNVSFHKNETKHHDGEKRVDDIIPIVIMNHCLKIITLKVFEGHKKGRLLRREARIATHNTKGTSWNCLRTEFEDREYL